MNGSMKVNTEELLNLGTKIAQEAEAYKNEVKKIYGAVDSVAWEGGVGQTYIEKVNEYKAEIENMGVVLTNYSEYLKQSANQIQNMQNSVIEAAGRL